MGCRFLGYRIPKNGPIRNILNMTEELYLVKDTVREFYIKEEPINILLQRRMWASPGSNSDMTNVIKLANQLKNEYECQMRVFDIGRYYYIEFCCRGYLIHNFSDELGLLEREFYYDNHGDMPKEYEKRGEVIDQIDTLIDRKHYLYMDIFTKNDMHELIWKVWSNMYLGILIPYNICTDEYGYNAPEWEANDYY